MHRFQIKLDRLLCLTLFAASCATTSQPPKDLDAPPNQKFSGGLTSQEVQGVIRKNLNQIRTCYEALLKTDPAAKGKIKLEFTIATEGHVESSEIVYTDTWDSDMQDCVKIAVLFWIFPKPRGGEKVTVTYPFVFNPL